MNSAATAGDYRRVLGFWKRPSTWLAASAAVLFALQLFSPTGIILMFLGAGVLTGLLVLLCLLSLAVESLIGVAPRPWLIVPVGCVIAYYGMALEQRVQLWSRGSAWANGNVPAMTATPIQPIMFELNQTIMGDIDVAAEYALNYSVRGIYFTTGGRNEATSYLTIVQPDSVCASPSKPRVRRPSRLWQIKNASGTLNLCLTEGVTLPAGAVTISRERDYPEGFGKGLVVERTIASQHGEVIGTFTSGRKLVSTFLPFPLFVGCGLNSAAPKWECAIGAQPEQVEIAATPKGYAGYLPAAVLLNLKPRSPAEIEAFNAP